jgi:hypothetical protein
MAKRATKHTLIDIEATKDENGEVDVVFYVEEEDDLEGFSIEFEEDERLN